MALQINQYTKTRTSGTITPEDLMDFDSTDDVGVSYESAKITVADFLSYVNANANNIYGADGTIIANRTLTANQFWTKWNDGDVKIDHLGEADSYGFVVEFGGVEMGRYGYAQVEQSASIVLDYFVGITQTNFFKAVDGQVGIMQDTPTKTFHVGNGAADTYSMLLENTSGDVAIDFYGMTMSRGGYQYIKSSLADGLSSLSLGSLGAGNDYHTITGSFTDNFSFRNGNTNTEFARFDADFNRFGLGTNVPSNTFHLVGTMRVEDGTEALGRVLTCDAVGIASWQNLPAGNGNIYDNDGTIGVLGTTRTVEFLGGGGAGPGLSTNLIFRQQLTGFGTPPFVNILDIQGNGGSIPKLVSEAVVRVENGNSNTAFTKFSTHNTDGIYSENGAIPESGFSFSLDSSNNPHLQYYNITTSFNTDVTYADPTANNVQTFQDASGTIALLTDINGGGIYDGSGSLTAATVVDMATNTSDLSFTTTGNGANSLMIDDSTGNVGIGGLPNAAAVLDVSSTTKGLLIPRMTGAQADVITKVDGLMIYVTSTSDVFTSIGFWGVVVNVWTKLDNL